MNSKKILITTEKREVQIVRNTKGAFNKCERCGKTVEMLSLDSATAHTGIRTREIFRLLENKDIHVLETETGHLLICKDSLSRLNGSERKNQLLNF